MSEYARTEDVTLAGVGSLWKHSIKLVLLVLKTSKTRRDMSISIAPTLLPWLAAGKTIPWRLLAPLSAILGVRKGTR